MPKRKQTTKDEASKISVPADKIAYVLIKKTLPHETLDKYLEKFRIFKLFFPEILSIGGSSSIEYEPGKYKDFDWDTDRGKYAAVEKIYIAKDLPKDMTSAYMWNFETKPDTDLDDLDKELLDLENNPDSFTKYEFYGLHTYGGYYGFLRPDLSEVINLIHPTITEEHLKNIDRIYVTSEPHPDSNIRNCYDNKQDRHRVKTTCYVHQNNKKSKNKE